MRLIGTLPDPAQSRRFVAYLHTLGVEAIAEPADSGPQVWVRDEDDVPRAKGELESFRADPSGAKYVAAEKESRDLVRKEQSERTKRRDKVVTGRQLWTSPGAGPSAQRIVVTWALIGASIALTLAIGVGNPEPGNWAWEWGDLGSERAAAMYLAKAQIQGETVTSFPPQVAFAKVLQGQIWRLVTPMFFHFSFMHLIFNMFVLYRLGGQIEDRIRAWRYLLLVLFFSAVSVATPALAPIAWGGHVWGGGMSGVVYGCFGFLWLKTLLEPNSGYRLSIFTVVILIGWHLITSMPGREAYFGASVANIDSWAHGAGLVAGAAVAAVSYLLNRAKA